ncbi:MAG TPA: GMC oxidoreductase [Sphingomicrobium sp.]|nr:GMC oxidoreductase [Sphingomicrobium sp.]
MIIDAADLAEGTLLRASVCIVGAGPVGLSVASVLARAGIETLLIEAADPALPAKDLETVQVTGLRYNTPAKRGRGVGGGSLTWNIETPVGSRYVRLWELDDLDFQTRPGVRDIGWPFSKIELQPFYRDAWSLFGLPPLDCTTEHAGVDGIEVLPFRMGPAAVFREHLPAALIASRRVRIVRGAVVTDVRTDVEEESVSSLRCALPSGAQLIFEANLYVLAGGAIEIARLLLASRSRHVSGLGNAHDHVGRYFMEHPHYDSGLVLPNNHRLVLEPSSWDVHERLGLAIQRKHQLPRSVIESEGLLATSFYVRARPPEDVFHVNGDGEIDVRRTESLQRLLRALPGRRLQVRSWLEAFKALPALPQAIAQATAQSRSQGAARSKQPTEAPPPTMTLRAMAEQVPDWLSRVTLGDKRDRFGMPVARLHWRIGDIDRRSMARSQQLAGPHIAAVLGAPVRSLIGSETPVWGGSHQMGTTRMAASPRKGVVDANCRVHGLSNLYVGGASVFPTVGMANPTLTAVALALRLGGLLAAKLLARPIV